MLWNKEVLLCLDHVCAWELPSQCSWGKEVLYDRIQFLGSGTFKKGGFFPTYRRRKCILAYGIFVPQQQPVTYVFCQIADIKYSNLAVTISFRNITSNWCFKISKIQTSSSICCYGKWKITSHMKICCEGCFVNLNVTNFVKIIIIQWIQ